MRKSIKLQSNKKDQPNEDLSKYVIGFITFIVFFIVIIPIILYNRRYYNFLEVYLPNVDLIANILTWAGGPDNIWTNLYRDDTNLSNFTTRTIINYIALLGITFIVARETKKSNNIFTGWSMAFVMLLCTYLLPGKVVTWFMKRTNTYLLSLNINNFSSYIVTILIGVLATLSFLFLEIGILKKYRKNIKKIARYIYTFPKKINL